MLKQSRSLAAAFSLGALAPAAVFAAPVTFNDAFTFNAGAGVVVTDQYAAQGILFSVLPATSSGPAGVVRAYNAANLPNGVPIPPPTDQLVNPTTEQLRQQGFVGGRDFVITIDTSLFSFDSLSLTFVGLDAEGASINVVGDGGTVNFPLVSPAAGWSWQESQRVVAAGDNGTARFVATALVPTLTVGSISSITVNGAAFLDNLSFGGATIPCTAGTCAVPEPSSYALTAIALLGLGAASRRRQNAKA